MIFYIGAPKFLYDIILVWIGICIDSFNLSINTVSLGEFDIYNWISHFNAILSAMINNIIA